MNEICFPVAEHSALLSIAGVPSTKRLIEALTAYLAELPSPTRLATKTTQDESVFAYLMNRRSDLALLEREITPVEAVPYKKLIGAQPLAIKVASLRPSDEITENASLAVYVHEDNPLTEITITQLRRIFTQGNPQGDYSDWAQLGGKPSRLQAFSLTENSSLTAYLLAHHFSGHEFSSHTYWVENTEALLQNIQGHRSAVGIAQAGRFIEGIKTLRIIDEPQVAMPATDSQIFRDPLTRFLYLYVAPPTTPVMTDHLRTFTDIMLSQQGQALLVDQPLYGPLTPEEIDQQKKKLAELL